MTNKSDVMQLAALLAAIIGVALLVFAFIGAVAAAGAGCVAASGALWLVGRELDRGTAE